MTDAPRLGIALLPSRDVLRGLVTLQGVLRQELPLQPVLGHKRNLPHVTLIQGRVADAASFCAAAAAVADALAGRAAPLLRFGPVQYQARGWLFLPVERTPDLFALHRKAFGHLSAHLLPPPPGADLGGYTALERANQLTYGYRYVGDAFNPHVTLGRNLEQAEAALPRVLSLTAEQALPCTCAVAAVSVYVVGPEGAHDESLALHALR